MFLFYMRLRKDGRLPDRLFAGRYSMSSPVRLPLQDIRDISPYPVRIDSQNFKSHPAFSLLFLMPSLSVLLAFSMFKVRRLRMAKFASAWPLRTRHLSSRSETSNCQCNWFSMPQWPLTVSPFQRSLPSVSRLLTGGCFQRQRRGTLPAWGTAPGAHSQIHKGRKARAIPFLNLSPIRIKRLETEPVKRICSPVVCRGI